MSEQGSAAVELKGVSKYFRSGEGQIRAVDHLDLKILAGQFVVIMGPSGSGKTTLLNCIAGLSSVSEGQILVNGKALQNLSESERALVRRNEVGFVFQFFNLHDGLTSLENVELPMMFANVPVVERRERAKKWLERLNLGKRLNNLPIALSGGEKQRVGIARALVNNAGILLADEPTGDLDHETGAEIMDLLAQLNKQDGKTIVMVTHDEEILRPGFRLLQLKDGRVYSDNLV